jgi:hypothetical protein
MYVVIEEELDILKIIWYFKGVGGRQYYILSCLYYSTNIGKVPYSHVTFLS